MVTEFVKSEYLAPLMYMEKSLEIVPEPFRCQRGRLSLVVDFKEYLLYLKKYSSIIPHTRGNHLRTMEILGKYDEDDLEAKKELFSKFMYDMAFTVGKELHYSTVYSKGGTSITHSVAGAQVLSSNEIDYLFDKSAGSVSYDFLLEMEKLGFPIFMKYIGENRDTYRYAVVCYFLATKGILWSFT